MTRATKLATSRILTALCSLVVCLGSAGEQAAGHAVWADQAPLAALVLLDLQRARQGSPAGDATRAVATPRSAAVDLRARRLEAAAVQSLATARGTGKRVDVRTARNALRSVRLARLEAARTPAHLATPGPALSQIQARLGSREVYISYGQRGTDVWAVVVMPSKSRAVRLGTEQALTALQDACVPSDNGAQAGCAARLRMAYAAPLQLPAGLTRISVAADASIARVPLALVFGARDVVRVMGHGVAKRRAPRGTRARSDAARVAGFGDPDFDVDPFAPADAETRRSTRAGSLVRLRETAAEVAAVSDLAYLRAQASESQLRELLRKAPRWRALHLTGHGHFNAAQPRLSGLQLTRTQADDGLLTAHEVAQMQIDVGLVVLSACETALVGAADGQACFGLSPAFLAAGARNVLSSL